MVVCFYFIFVNEVSAQKKNSKKNKKKIEVVKADTVQSIQLVLDKSPVNPFRDTIFFIYGNIGSFSSQQRAEAIKARIVKLEEDPFFEDDSLKLVDVNGNIDIFYRGDIILSVDTLQATYLKSTRTELAKNYLLDIISAIQKQRDETSVKRIAIQVGYTILILAFLCLFIWLLYQATRRIRALIWLQKGKRIKGFFGIIDADRSVHILIWIVKFIRLLLVLFSIYWGLWGLFKIYPSTMAWADLLWGYVIVPIESIFHSVVDYLPKLFTIIVIILVFRYIQKFIRSIAKRISDSKISIKGFYPDWAFPTYNIISVILYVFMFIFIFPYLPKSDSTVFQGVSVFAGLVISLGSTSVIGDLVAGLVITYMRPFKIGDRIKMDDCIGNVVEKTPLVTRLKTTKNELITIPNSNVMNSKTINYSLSARQYGLILYTTVTISYDVPWTKVHELLKQVAERTEYLIKKQKLFILQEALDEFYVSYQLNVYTREADKMPHIYSELRKNIQDVFGEAGVELLSPHYRVNKNINEIEN